MLESCNVTLFASGTGNQTLVKQLFTGPLAQYLNDHPNILDGFRVLVVQLASSKDLVYVNACLLNNAQTKDESSVRWKVNLDAPLKGKPFIVEDGESRYVIAFDSQNVMNFINKEGQILWKKAFDEPPLGEVFAIDNNGQVQFLFNTAHTIQLIDREGNNVDGYPVRLPFEA